MQQHQLNREAHEIFSLFYGVHHFCIWHFFMQNGGRHRYFKMFGVS